MEKNGKFDCDVQELELEFLRDGEKTVFAETANSLSNMTEEVRNGRENETTLAAKVLELQLKLELKDARLMESDKQRKKQEDTIANLNLELIKLKKENIKLRETQSRFEEQKRGIVPSGTSYENRLVELVEGKKIRDGPTNFFNASPEETQQLKDPTGTSKAPQPRMLEKEVAAPPLTTPLQTTQVSSGTTLEKELAHVLIKSPKIKRTTTVTDSDIKHADKAGERYTKIPANPKTKDITDRPA